MEDEVVEKLCGVIGEEFELPFCRSILQDMWAAIANKCPMDAALEDVAALPGPIEVLLCDVLMDKGVGDGAVEQLCGVIEMEFKLPFCSSILKDVWASTAKRCPNGAALEATLHCRSPS